MMNNKMKSIGVISFIAILSALVSIAAIARQAEDPGVLLRAAIEKEEVDGDLPAAIDLYKQIVAKFGDNRPIAAKALLRLGGCYEKLGEQQAGLAQKAFEKVIESYPDQTEAVKLAKEKLAVFLRARALIEKGDQEFKITKVHTEKGRSGYFSPDGKKLALIEQKGNNLNIWLRDIASGKEVCILSTSGDLHDLFWSPDSLWIAYISGTNSVNILPAEGGQPKTIIEGHPVMQAGDDYIWPMGWTPDSKKLIVQDTAKGLFAIPTAGGDLEEIYRFPDSKKAKERDEWLTLSPDGKLIAYQSTQGGNQDIYVMPAQGGEPVRITDDPASDNWPLWSYDGRWLAFNSARTGRSETWVIRIMPDGKPEGEPIQASRGGAGVWMRDGRIAYSTRKVIFHIFVANADGSGEVQLTKLNQGALPRWSPDAKTIAFASMIGEGRQGRAAVWTVPSNGGDEKFLVLGDSPAWSPDGKKIAFVPFTGYPPAQTIISIIPAEGGEAKELVRYDGSTTKVFDWSPDGRYIAFSYVRRENAKDPIPGSRPDIEDIYIVSVNGGEPKRLTQMDKKGFRFTCPRFSPDGKKIAFRSLDYEGFEKGRLSEPISIYTIDIGGGEPKLVTNEFSDWWFCWSPDGRSIISPKQEKDSPGPYGADLRLYKVSAEGGTPEKLNIMGRMPDFSADGKKIAYSRLSEYGTEFWMAENFLPKETAAKRTPHELTIRKLYEGSGKSAWLSPDGTRLALNDYNTNTLWLRDVATGKEVCLIPPPEPLTDCSWSPDSKLIAYFAYSGDIKIVPAEGGQPKTLIERDSEMQKAGRTPFPMGWTSDSKKVIFQVVTRGAFEGLYTIPASGGPWEEVHKFPYPQKAKERDEWLTLSPDGRLIAFQSTRDGNQDIYVMPARSGEPVRITDDPGSEKWPVWSHDSRWLAFDSDRTGSWETWVIKITPDGQAGCAPVQATRGGEKGIWTRDGKIAYSRETVQTNVYIANVDGSQETQLTKPKVLYMSPRWSPDGKTIAFAASYGTEANRTAVWTVPVNGGNEKFLAVGVFPAWSPDGKEVAYCSELRRMGETSPHRAIISIIPANGGEPRELMNYHGELTGLDWSPDGRQLVFSYNRVDGKNPIPDSREKGRDIYVVSVTGGEPKRLTRTDNEALQYMAPCWSPDGHKVAYLWMNLAGAEETGQPHEPARIYTMDLEGGEPRLVTNEDPAFWPCWSRDGKYVIFPNSARELYRVPAEGGKAEKLNIKGGAPDLSPDGTRIAFYRRAENRFEIWLVENFLPGPIPAK
jgi:Tol biopolymer transport system component